MTTTTLKTRIQHKYNTPAKWAEDTTFVPLKGEICVFNNGAGVKPEMKIGDGITTLASLPFLKAGGDITVSRSLTSGTKIATITVDGVATDLYCQTNTDTTYSVGTGLSLSGTTFSIDSSVLTTNNYTDYVPTKTGDGASGTWGVSISGNAATATTASKTQAALSLNGKSFNGSAAVDIGTLGVAYGGTGRTSLVTPTVTWTNGSTAGPTLTIKDSLNKSSTAVTIPAASDTISGIITTGAQAIIGTKTIDGIVLKTHRFMNEITPTAGWYRIAKLEYYQGYFNLLLFFHGNYNYGRPSTAVVHISGMHNTPILKQIAGDTNSFYTKVRLVGSSDAYYLEVYSNATDGPIGHQYVSFLGIGTISAVYTPTTPNGATSTYNAEISLRTMKDTVTFAVTDNSATNTGEAVTYDSSSNIALKLPATIKASLTGNATTASAWATARTLTLAGDLSGSVSIKGDAAMTLTATVKDDSHNHVVSNIDNLQTNLDNKAGGSNYIDIVVKGNANTYYPVVLTHVADYYPMQFVNISRDYSETAPDAWNTTTHKGGLTMTLLWNGSRYWDGNGSGSPCYCVYKYESYCTMVGGLGNSTTGIVIWLRGGTANYHIHSLNGKAMTATVYLTTYTDGAGQSFAPKTTPSAVDVRWPEAWMRGDSVTGAVWNDYAEYRESDCQEFGRILIENGNDTLSISTERLQPFAGISSDTWGFCQGETERAKTPIAVAGRVLAYPFRDRNEYKPGDCVCAAPDGTVDIMTREEIERYPDRIVGTVSCVPEYEEWGSGDRPAVRVDGRIWVKVR